MSATIKVVATKDMAAIDELIRRTREALVDEYREVVWEIFCRILEQTPQFTGRAVAHWDIQVDGDTSYFQDDSIGKVVNMVDPQRKKKGQFVKRQVAQQRGNPEFIEIAKRRNEPKLKLIRRGSVVRFTNNVRGDTDNGTRSEFYMQELQDSDYWLAKLRKVNQPYETAQESVALIQAMSPGSKGNGVVTFKHTRYALAYMKP